MNCEIRILIYIGDVSSMMFEKDADFQLDAAQRKKLPLWIREGLEKMEREKQRKVNDSTYK